MSSKTKLFLTVTGAALLALSGCGGGGANIATGGAGGGGGGGGGGTPAAEPGTAKFSVDLQTGQVSVTDLTTGDPRALAVFAGTKVGFASSTVIDQPGNTGRKAINVSVINRSGEPIGQAPGASASGVRVIFNSFVNLSSGTDLRSRTTVTSFAGSGAAGATDGAQNSATFDNPVGIARAGNGAFYVTDSGNNKIRKIFQGQVSTLAGSGGAGSANGAGPNATFNVPVGITVHPDGDLVVADSLSNKIRKITPEGVVFTIAGTGAAGGANGAGSTATFNRPQAIAISSTGVIYVSEQLGHRIRRITFAGGDDHVAANYTVSTLAGTGVAGSVNGIGTGASFNEPRGLALDSANNLYVADTNNHRIRRINSTGEVATVAGTGAGGSVDGLRNVATLNLPYGIVIAGSSLIISEIGGRKLRQISLVQGGNPNTNASWLVKSIAGTGTAGATNGAGHLAQFQNPHLIAYDGGSNIYACDYNNNNVRRIASVGSGFPIPVQPQLTSTEKVELANADGNLPTGHNVIKPYMEYLETVAPNAATSQKPWVFTVPGGINAFEFTVTVEAATSFLAGLEGGNNIPSSKNLVSTVAGMPLGGYLNGVATEAKFNSANGIAVDAEGNLFVADTNNHAIRRVSRSGQVTTVVGAAGQAGSLDSNGASASLNGPRGVTVSPDGKVVYATDSNNHTIRRIKLVGPDPGKPGDWSVTTIAGFVGDATYAEGPGGSARFNFPVGIALTPTGNLIVTEFSGNRVRLLQNRGGEPDFASNWLTSLIAGSSVSPVGTAGSTNGFGTSARFDLPAHVAVDAAGNAYVADVNNSRIRKITPTTDVSTLAGSTFGEADGVGTAAQFGQPNGVTVDSSGYVFVADTSFHQIRRISPSGIVTTVAGTGETFPGDVDGPGTVARFYFPLGITVDRSGRVYVVSGGSYLFEGGGGVTSPGLKVRMLQRVIE